MLEGKCPQCGYHCGGWALRFPQNQMCPKCGAGLEIREGGRKIATGFSPFNAEKYYVDLPSSPRDKAKSGRKPKKHSQS